MFTNKTGAHAEQTETNLENFRNKTINKFKKGEDR